MKLLIVDDEELTRNGLFSAIPWESLGITEVYQAADGIYGLQSAKEHQPEVILCDVRMPRMDGIMMAREVQQLLPDSSIIFMSGYSDKEYLKAAIRLRAVRYVEKPLNTAEVCEAVLEACEHCRERRKTHLGQSHLEQEQTARLALLLTLPYGKHSEAIIPLWNALKLPDPARTGVTTILAKFDSQEPFTESKLSLLNKKISGFLEPYSLFPLIAHRYQDYLVIHICGHRNMTARDRSEILSFLQQLCNTYRNYYLTCGQSFSHISKAYESYGTSVFLMESSFFFEPNTVLTGDHTADQMQIKPASAPLPPDLPENFIDALMDKDEKLATRYAQEIYAFYYQNTHVLSDHAKETYYRLLTGIEECRSRLKINAATDASGSGKTVMRYLEEFFSLTQLHQALLMRVRSFFHDLEHQTEENPTIYLIKCYIRDHYNNDSLSVKDISEHVHLTASYLCTIFKAETNKTLNQYITEYRMERAKKLLKDPRYKITEISAMVGYNDGNYFGKSFKKTVGISPSEFREKWMI